MSSSSKVESSQTPPKNLPSEPISDVPTCKTDFVEPKVAKPQMNNVEKLDATKHGTNLDKENNKKEEEEEIDIDLNDPEVGKVAAKLQSGFFSRFGRKSEPSPAPKPTQSSK